MCNFVEPLKHSKQKTKSQLSYYPYRKLDVWNLIAYCTLIVRRSIWRKIHGVKYYLVGLFCVSFSYSGSVLMLTVENHLSRTVFSRKFTLVPQFPLGLISYCTSTLTVSDFRGQKFMILQLLEHPVSGKPRLICTFFKLFVNIMFYFLSYST